MILPRLAVSVGCPRGIGPEVSVVAASFVNTPVILVGDEAVLRYAAVLRGIDQTRWVRMVSKSEILSLPAGHVGIWQPTPPLAAEEWQGPSPTPEAGGAQLAWVDAASDLVTEGFATALVTGPVSKEAIVRSGGLGTSRFRGHTEHLQERLGAKEVVMAFWTERLTTALVTTHLPLAAVAGQITAERVAISLYWLAWLLTRHTTGTTPPRIAVAGLNPHAGEGGILGHEEAEHVGPGMEIGRQRMREAGVLAEVVGPLPAEVAFRLGAQGVYQGVVAMYHDQATIPMKLLHFGEAVNVSLGLPWIRTSVDHGTAYDLAWTGKANAQGMQEAMQLALRLSNDDTF